MVTDVLPPDAGIADIPLLIAAPIGSPLRPDDYGRLLRVLLREQIWKAQFMSLCGVGYLYDVVRKRMASGLQLAPEIVYGEGKIAWRDLGLELELPHNGPDPNPVRFFIAVSIVPPMGTVAILERVPPLPSNHLQLRHLSELAFFEEMQAQGVDSARALSLVHRTLWSAAVAETPDRVEPTATRLERIGELIAIELQKRGIAW